jgi:hypothetical protein
MAKKCKAISLDTLAYHLVTASVIASTAPGVPKERPPYLIGSRLVS